MEFIEVSRSCPARVDDSGDTGLDACYVWVFLVVAGVEDVGVDVDQAGRNDLPRGVDDADGFRPVDGRRRLGDSPLAATATSRRPWMP